MDRREFIQGTTTLLAAGAVSALPGTASITPMGLPIGIQLYTVGSDLQKDAADTVGKIARIGYKEVESAGFGSAASAAALRKMLDENGLKCPSAHLSFDLKNLNRAFDDAHALGCTYATASVPRLLVMDAMPAMDGAMSEAERAAAMGKIIAALSAPLSTDELKRLIDAMNQVGAAAAQQGLTFAAHNHTFEFELVDGRPAIYRMMEQTDAKNVKFEVDCGWAEVAGFHPGDLATAYPGRIKMLHIKDFLPFEKGVKLGAANGPKGSEIGQGVVDYKKIFAGIAGKGVEHIFVEQEGPYSRMAAMEAAKVDYDYLKALSS